MANNDLNQISKLLDEKLTATEKRLRTEITTTEKRFNKRLTATEEHFNKRLTSTEEHLRADITSAITDSGDNIIEEIAGFMEVNLLPKLEDKADKSDIERVERRIDYSADKIGEHDIRLKNIESIPVIAHELKLKKK